MTDIDINVNGGDPTDTAAPAPQDKPKEPSAWQRLRGSRIATAILAILFSLTPLLATRLAVLATETGKTGSHYLSDSKYYLPYTIVLICTLLLSFLPFIFINSSKLDKEHIVPRIFNLIPACGAAFTAYLFFYFSSAEGFFESENKWAMYISVCGFICAAFFILKILGNKMLPNVMAGLRVLGSIGVFAFCALIIVSLYLDYTTELNSHFKLSVQFGAVGVMLSTMADARSALGGITTRRYLAFKSAALTLTSTCAASVFTRALDEISAYKIDQGILNLSLDDLVIHFQSTPSACASYLLASFFFAACAVCIIPEMIFAALTSHKCEK